MHPRHHNRDMGEWTDHGWDVEERGWDDGGANVGGNASAGRRQTPTSSVSGGERKERRGGMKLGNRQHASPASHKMRSPEPYATLPMDDFKAEKQGRTKGSTDVLSDIRAALGGFKNAAGEFADMLNSLLGPSLAIKFQMGLKLILAFLILTTVWFTILSGTSTPAVSRPSRHHIAKPTPPARLEVIPDHKFQERNFDSDNLPAHMGPAIAPLPFLGDADRLAHPPMGLHAVHPPDIDVAPHDPHRMDVFHSDPRHVPMPGPAHEHGGEGEEGDHMGNLPQIEDHESEENLPHHVGFAHAATEVDHLPDHLPHGDGGGPWDEAHQPLEGLATDETVEKEGQDAWGGLQPHVQGDGGQADDELDGDDAAGSLEGQGALGGDSSFEFEVEAEGNNDEAATHMQGDQPALSKAQHVAHEEGEGDGQQEDTANRKGAAGHMANTLSEDSESEEAKALQAQRSQNLYKSADVIHDDMVPAAGVRFKDENEAIQNNGVDVIGIPGVQRAPSRKEVAALPNPQPEGLDTDWSSKQVVEDLPMPPNEPVSAAGQEAHRKQEVHGEAAELSMSGVEEDELTKVKELLERAKAKGKDVSALLSMVQPRAVPGSNTQDEPMEAAEPPSAGKDLQARAMLPLVQRGADTDDPRAGRKGGPKQSAEDLVLAGAEDEEEGTHQDVEELPLAAVDKDSESQGRTAEELPLAAAEEETGGDRKPEELPTAAVGEEDRERKRQKTGRPALPPVRLQEDAHQAAEELPFAALDEDDKSNWHAAEKLPLATVREEEGGVHQEAEAFPMAPVEGGEEKAGRDPPMAEIKEDKANQEPPMARHGSPQQPTAFLHHLRGQSNPAMPSRSPSVEHLQHQEYPGSALLRSATGKAGGFNGQSENPVHPADDKSMNGLEGGQVASAAQIDVPKVREVGLVASAAGGDLALATASAFTLVKGPSAAASVSGAVEADQVASAAEGDGALAPATAAWGGKGPSAAAIISEGAVEADQVASAAEVDLPKVHEFDLVASAAEGDGALAPATAAWGGKGPSAAASVSGAMEADQVASADEVDVAKVHEVELVASAAEGDGALGAENGLLKSAKEFSNVYVAGAIGEAAHVTPATKAGVDRGSAGEGDTVLHAASAGGVLEAIHASSSTVLEAKHVESTDKIDPPVWNVTSASTKVFGVDQSPTATEIQAPRNGQPLDQVASAAHGDALLAVPSRADALESNKGPSGENASAAIAWAEQVAFAGEGGAPVVALKADQAAPAAEDNATLAAASAAVVLKGAKASSDTELELDAVASTLDGGPAVPATEVWENAGGMPMPASDATQLLQAGRVASIPQGVQ